MVEDIYMNVILYGGCATRDVFSFDEFNGVKIIKYFSRTVPASLFQKKTSIFNGIPKSFNERLCFDDFEKNFVKMLNACESVDYIVMDFGTAAYANLFKLECGAIGTLANPQRKFLLDNGIKHKMIKSWDDYYVSLHNDGMLKLCELIRDRGFEKKIILNKLFAATRYNDNVDRDFEKSIEINKRLTSIYEVIDSELGEVLKLEYPLEVFVGEAYTHKWGVNFFHYTNDFYDFQKKELLKIFNGSSFR